MRELKRAKNNPLACSWGSPRQRRAEELPDFAGSWAIVRANASCRYMRAPASRHRSYTVWARGGRCPHTGLRKRCGGPWRFRQKGEDARVRVELRASLSSLVYRAWQFERRRSLKRRPSRPRPAIWPRCPGVKPPDSWYCLLYFDPSTATPIAVATTGLAPAIVLAFFPAPIIGHDAEPQGRLVPRLTADAPAVAFVVTHYGSWGRSGAEGKHAGSYN